MRRARSSSPRQRASPRRRCQWRAHLGRRGPALRAALGAQLGHRRLHRPRAPRRASGVRAARTSSASTRCTRCSRTTRRTRARTVRPAGSSSMCSTSTSRRSRTSRECDAAQTLVRAALSSRRGCERCARRALVDYAGVAAAKLRGARAACTRTSARSTSRRDTARARAFRSVPRARGRGAAPPRAVRGAAGALPAARIRRPGAGPSGPQRIATRPPREVGRFATSGASAWSSSNTCSGRRTSSSQRRAPRCASSDSASASTPTWRCRSTAAAPKAGRTRRSTRFAASVGAPPDDFNPHGQDWGLPPLDPASACARPPMRPSSRRCARTCATPARCASTTSWGLLRLFWVPPGSPPADGRLRALSARRPARHPRAREPAQPLPGDRRGSRHRPRRDAPAHCTRTACSRTGCCYFERDARRRVQAARGVSRAGAGRGEHPRPADARGLVGRPRPQRARRAAWPDAGRAARQAQVAARAGPRARCCWRSSARALAAAGDATPSRGPELTPALARARARLSRAHAGAGHGGAARGRARRASTRSNLPGHRPSSIRTGGASSRCALERWRDDARFAALARRARARARAAPQRRSGRHGAGAAHRAARDLPPAAAPRLRLRTGDRAGALSRRARRQPRVLLAVPARAAGQPARLRHRRPRRAQPGDRQPTRTSSASCAALRAPRHGPDPRHGAEPHGRDGRRQRVVARRARERPGVARTPTSSTSTGRRSTRTLAGKVLLPVLGDHYGAVLERGELELAFEAARRLASRVRYSRAPLPARPARVPARARARGAPARARRGRPRRALASSQRLIAAFGTCRRAMPHRAGAVAERSRDKEVAQAPPRAARRATHPALARGDRARRCAAFNGSAGERASFDAPARAARRAGLPARLLARRLRRDQLPALLRHQRPRRAAHGERRGVRGDAPAGARARARRATSTACASTIPTGCTIRRSTSGGCRSATPRAPASPARAPMPHAARPLYVVVEKIVAPHEQPAGELAGPRHHRLPLRQRGERPVRRHRGRARASTAPGGPSCATRRIDFDEVAYRAQAR